MDHTLTQHIEIRKDRAGQDRAYIAGTRVRVQDIYVDSEVLGKSPDEIVAALPHLFILALMGKSNFLSLITR